MKLATRNHKRHRPLALLSKANRASHHLKKDVDLYLMKKPYRTLGLIMLTGVCVGYLIHRH